jgi:hypothetical protein
MRTIEIRVYEDGFADTLAAMREWLEREKLYLAHFRHENGDGIIVMSVGFANPDDPRVDAFHRKFGDLAEA